MARSRGLGDVYKRQDWRRTIHLGLVTNSD
jgi:hypothetical protein